MLSDQHDLDAPRPMLDVSMHLLVLSAFRPVKPLDLMRWLVRLSQCTFWCSVLSDMGAIAPERLARHGRVSMHLLVLSAFRQTDAATCPHTGSVSMHLLVLSAFRPRGTIPTMRQQRGLNAPFGAQCFPTFQ